MELLRWVRAVVVPGPLRLLPLSPILVGHHAGVNARLWPLGLIVTTLAGVSHATVMLLLLLSLLLLLALHGLFCNFGVVLKEISA